MPTFASAKQRRMMMAILAGKKGTTSRGDSGPPKNIAEKYSGSGEGLEESKGKEHHGGRWDEHAHRRHAEKKNKKKLKKSKGGVGLIVVNDRGQVLLGRHYGENEWALPGGHIDSGESAELAAKREAKEETGIDLNNEGDELREIHDSDGDKTFVINLKESRPVHSTEELSDVGFYDLDNIDLSKLRGCCVAGMKAYLDSKLSKGKRSIKDMIALESLQKNILRTGQVANAVHELTHGDALKLVGNGAFRMISRAVDGMKDDESKDFDFDSYKIHVRKHANDVYSGRVEDGQKTIHQFVNRSLPALTGEIMSVFEWYLPEDHPELEIHDEDKLSDETIEDGIKKLSSNHDSYNVSDIYSEMESIRREIRQGNAVDLQQAEVKIMSLFDKLEDRLKETQKKHNELARKASKEIDEIYSKLVEMQSKIESLSKKPSKVEAYSSEPANPNKIHDEYYPYLPRPKVTIKPDGHITIEFTKDWTSDEKSNFLKDMKAKALNKGNKR